MTNQRAQVLVFLALVLPVVLVPLAAFTIDSAFVASRYASLQAAVAETAEISAQRIDVAALRDGGALVVDARQVQLTAAGWLGGEDPRARLEAISVSGARVTLTASERVELPIALTARSVVLYAHASARIVAGYDSPSSRLPLPTSTF